jgi:hypothetical protein
MAKFKITKWTHEVQSGTGDLQVFESHRQGVVRYEGPYFLLDAEVEYETPAKETWTIGIVQTCDAISLKHSYNNSHHTCWEFPTPVSDFWTDSRAGTTSYPYYSLDAPNAVPTKAQAGVGRVVLAKGTTGTKTLSMNDNLASNVQYWDPVPNGRDNYDASYTHRLTRIERDQSFTTFVVAHPGTLTSSSSYQVLGKVQWRHHMVMEFDCTKALGQRSSKSFGTGHGVLSHHRHRLGGEKLPPCVFVQTCANDTQKLRGYKGGNFHREIKW